MSVSSLVTLLVLAVLFFGVIAIYNRLVNLRARYRNAFAQIEVQLKRRYDLIPNLVETAKAYLKHERETLEAVIAARNAAVAGLKAAASQPGAAAGLAQLASA
ncbi:LemA family protein, partial [Pseudomonas citronellolis]